MKDPIKGSWKSRVVIPVIATLFRKQWLLSVRLCAATSISGISAAATFTLNDKLWELLVVPADPSSVTIASLFEDAFAPVYFGIAWIIFTYDSATATYLSPDIDTSLQAGQAFWISQSTGASIDTNLPDSLPPADVSTEDICVPDSSCVQLPLYASVSGIGWNLVGAPLGEPSSTDDFRVANDVSGYPCSTGCDLNPAVTAGQITGPVWIFDSSTSGYIDARVAGNVTSGQGFWMATLPPAKDTQPILYVPGSATACSLCVPPDGDKANDGACANTPLESVQTAIDLMSAGDTLCLMQGVYRAPVVLADKTGSATHPITIRVMPGDEGQVQIRGSIRSLQTGLEVCNSYNVNVIGLDIQQVLRGIQFNSVSGGSVDSNLVSNIEHGMEPRIKQVNSNP